MKLQYISRYSTEEAVSKYCDEKAWKLGHPQHRYHQIAVSEHLLHKIEPFILACKEENRDQARNSFSLKISQNLSVMRPPVTDSKEKLEDRIRQKFSACFPDLVAVKEDSEDEFRLCQWNNAESIEVKAKWRVIKNGFFPAEIEITSLRANCLKKGRATHFLKAIVSALQEDADPYAKIKLYAWTGYNSYYGRANGAFTWSRLGFELREDTKEEKIDLGLSPTSSVISSWKQTLSNSFNPQACRTYFFSILSRPQLDSILAPNFISLVDAEIKKCQNTWEVSAIVIQDIPIGQYLMAIQNEASYPGVLYPNCPQSPGMMQYNKRLQELVPIV